MIKQLGPWSGSCVTDQKFDGSEQTGWQQQKPSLRSAPTMCILYKHDTSIHVLKYIQYIQNHHFWLHMIRPPTQNKASTACVTAAQSPLRSDL